MKATSTEISTRPIPMTLTLHWTIIIYFLIGWASSYGQMPVHDSHGDKIHGQRSWDQINGQRITKSCSIGFLLRKGYSKHVSPSSELIDLLAQDYNLYAPSELDIKIVSIKAGFATIRLGDLDSPNMGVGVRVIVQVQIPEGTPSGTRRIELEFPNAIRIRNLVNAESPTTVPTITFTVTNFASEKNRAAVRWWQVLLFGVGFVLAALIASAVVPALVDMGESSFVAVIIAMVLWVCACALIGRAVQDLRIIHEHAFLILTGLFAIPFLILLCLIPIIWPGSLTVAVFLIIVAIVCWLKGWTRVEFGALILLPGIGLGTIVGGLMHALRSKKV